jgi:nicotinate-nucleotide adenylyltransferase
VFRHPFGKPLVGSYEHRLALCAKVAAQLAAARVSRAEEESGETRTVDLLQWLQHRHPGTRFALVLGTDLDAEKAQWKQFDRVEQLARIITVQRGGYRSLQAGAVAIPEISSTQVRSLLKSGGDASHLVPRAVLQSIRDAGTYR